MAADPSHSSPSAAEPRIRRREPSDLAACARVLRAVHDGDGYPVDWPDDPLRWLAQASLLEAWVAELDGEVVGQVGLCRSSVGDLAAREWSRRTGLPAEATSVVSRLFVAPTARGHGLGALLLARATHAARSRGLHPVLDVVSTDTAAAALYRRAGWSLLTTVEDEWGPGRTVTVHCYAAPQRHERAPRRPRH